MESISLIWNSHSLPERTSQTKVLRTAPGVEVFRTWSFSSIYDVYFNSRFSCQTHELLGMRNKDNGDEHQKNIQCRALP